MRCSSEMEMKWKMIEQAKEELQRLETQHPGRFSVLKLELKSFIVLLEESHLDSHHLLLHSCSSHDRGDPSPASPAATQASTSRKRVGFRKPSTMEAAGKKHTKIQRIDGQTKSRDDRVEAVLQRAKNCLRKIQALKTSLR